MFLSRLWKLFIMEILQNSVCVVKYSDLTINAHSDILAHKTLFILYFESSKSGEESTYKVVDKIILGRNRSNR